MVALWTDQCSICCLSTYYVYRMNVVHACALHVNMEAASSAFSGSPKENTYSCERRKVGRVEYLSQGLSSKVRWELGEKSKSFQQKSMSISLNNFSYCYSLSYSSTYPSSDQIFSRFISESSAEMNKTWSPRPLFRIKWEANPNHPINMSLSAWDAVQLPTSQLTTKWVITSLCSQTSPALPYQSVCWVRIACASDFLTLSFKDTPSLFTGRSTLSPLKMNRGTFIWS